MKSVYVNGILNNAIIISDIDRLTKNIRNSFEARLPNNNAQMARILPNNANAAVNVYKNMIIICHCLSNNSNSLYVE